MHEWKSTTCRYLVVVEKICVGKMNQSLLGLNVDDIMSSQNGAGQLPQSTDPVKSTPENERVLFEAFCNLRLRTN